MQSRVHAQRLVHSRVHTAGVLRPLKPTGSRARGLVRSSRAHSLRPNESPDQTQTRRLAESLKVEERVIDIYDEAEFHHQLETAGDKLIVLEVESESVCQGGPEDEPEFLWKVDKEASMAPCRGIKHSLQRIARECPDVKFLSMQADSDQASALCDKLGVDVLPTVQFWRNGTKLWEHRGVQALQQDIGEGVLFYGDSAAGGARASEWVAELHNAEDLRKFVNAQSDKVLTVVDVSLNGAAGCVHIYPAVLALARSFQGYATFARLMGDESGETRALLQELNIVEVPTFLFFRAGKEVGRFVGSSRGDLIGQILKQQSAMGISPPPPPNGNAVPRRSGVRR